MLTELVREPVDLIESMCDLVTELALILVVHLVLTLLMCCLCEQLQLNNTSRAATIN